jgi:hypothetical protein
MEGKYMLFWRRPNFKGSESRGHPLLRRREMTVHDNRCDVERPEVALSELSSLPLLRMGREHPRQLLWRVSMGVSRRALI